MRSRPVAPFPLPAYLLSRGGQPATLARSCGFNLLVFPRPGQIFLSYTGRHKIEEVRQARGAGGAGSRPSGKLELRGKGSPATFFQCLGKRERRRGATGRSPGKSATKGRNSNRRRRQRGTRTHTLAEKERLDPRGAAIPPPAKPRRESHAAVTERVCLSWQQVSLESFRRTKKKEPPRVRR